MNMFTFFIWHQGQSIKTNLNRNIFCLHSKGGPHVGYKALDTYRRIREIEVLALEG